MSSTSSSSKLRSISIGKRKVNVDEFFTLAFGDNVEIELNSAVTGDAASPEDTATDAAAPAKGAKAAKRFLPPTDLKTVIEAYAEPLTPANTLCRPCSRAVLVQRALTFLQGRANMNSEVVPALIALLNAKITPVMPHVRVASDVQVLSYLAAAFDPATAEALGVTPMCYVGPKTSTWVPLSEACAAAGITLPTLHPFEVMKFTQDKCASQAVQAVATYRARATSKLMDATAALSLEAINAFTEPFSQAHHDVARPFASAIEVAAMIRFCLEGSPNVNKAAKKVQDPACVRDIPSVFAAFRDSVALASSAARVELNSAEAAGSATVWQNQPSFSGTFNLQVCVSLAHAAQTALAQSLSRSAAVAAAAKAGAEKDMVSAKAAGVKHAEVLDALLAAAADIKADAEISAKLLTETVAPALAHAPASATAACIRAVSGLERAVALEAAVAMHVLSARDAAAADASLKALAVKREATLKRIADWKAQDEKAVAEGTARPDPKRCPPAPADVDASKAKGILVGAGSQQVRSAFLAAFAAAGAEAGMVVDAEAAPADAAAAFLKAANSAVSPFTPATVDAAAAATAIVNQTTLPKLPKGTRDTSPELMAVRERAFEMITSVFQAHGGVGIDTPVFERKEILTGKYGEDSKLIYDLASQGGEILSLRYDLTVPFARYCATNGVKNIKRYHIAKVYRRDNPVMSKGRFREFFQCDFDIAGVYPPMVADAEAVTIMGEILRKTEVGNFKIKLSHRVLLDALMIVSGVPAALLRPICSAIDKLDKEPWSAVRSEMVDEKGLAPAAADKLGSFFDGGADGPEGGLAATLAVLPPLEALARLEQNPDLAGNAQARIAFGELRTLFEYLEAMGGINCVSFDLSLARGLDYYTGVIYEAVFTEEGQVGSVAAGGRYDNLLGMFGGQSVPAVGLSIGLERVLTIMEAKERARSGAIKTTKTQVLVASVGNGLFKERMRLSAELWAAGVPTEFLFAENPNIRKQMEFAFDGQVPIIAWIGEDEVNNGVVTVKTLTKDKEEQSEAITVKRADVPAKVKELLASLRA